MPFAGILARKCCRLKQGKVCFDILEMHQMKFVCLLEVQEQLFAWGLLAAFYNSCPFFIMEVISYLFAFLVVDDTQLVWAQFYIVFMPDEALISTIALLIGLVADLDLCLWHELQNGSG